MSIASGKENRRRVAQKVIEQVLNNKKINISKAMREVGYKQNTANTKCVEVRKSKEFQEETNNFIDQLEELVQDNIKHAKEKQRKASFRDSIEAIDKLKKLSREVSGVPTQSVIKVQWED